MTGASLAKCQSLLHYIFLSFVGVCVSVCVWAHTHFPPQDVCLPVVVTGLKKRGCTQGKLEKMTS